MSTPASKIFRDGEIQNIILFKCIEDIPGELRGLIHFAVSQCDLLGYLSHSLDLALLILG
jgi:hypothetical protein